MSDTATRHGQIEDEIFSDDVSDEALEGAAGADPYTFGFCHPTDRCTAPAMPALITKTSGR
jgi:hypothetical protein